ncbi:MAG: FAD:protein FMN transferase [Lachnospiraceae bacterium]|nr:FAD:protein FMN transferase [Lachnospiraceae bacterium]
MNKKIKTLLKMLILALGLLGLFIVITKKMKPEEIKDAETIYDFAMGTSVTIKLYGVEDEEAYAGDIVTRINDISDNLISWRVEESQLYDLNNNYKTGEKFAISDELNEILSMSYKICKDSDGALDITIRPLANLWGIEDATADTFSIPDFQDIVDMVPEIGYENITLTNGGVILNKDDMLLDFGATGKGYALDVIREEYIKDKVDGAIITIGGSVLVYGEKYNGKDWNIGIRDPFGEEGDMIGYLSFASGTNMCISTSGDYEKYIEKDGIKYHHIFDRVTGYPASAGLASVTVVCENGLASDGLSTACFVMGYDNSLPLLEKYKAEAVFVLTSGEIIVTDGLKDNFSEDK